MTPEGQETHFLILVLGGAGDMGSGVVEELCRAGVEADIGDIRVETAARIAESLRETGKLNVVKVDVSKREELVGLLGNIWWWLTR